MVRDPGSRCPTLPGKNGAGIVPCPGPGATAAPVPPQGIPSPCGTRMCHLLLGRSNSNQKMCCKIHGMKGWREGFDAPQHPCDPGAGSRVRREGLAGKGSRAVRGHWYLPGRFRSLPSLPGAARAGGMPGSGNILFPRGKMRWSRLSCAVVITGILFQTIVNSIQRGRSRFRSFSAFLCL